MALLKFLKGNYNSLENAAIAEGQVLICNDTCEMFVDIAADKRIKIGDFTVVSNLEALEALDATKVPTSRLYYVESGNILARSNGVSWVQVNKQPTADEMKTLLGLGSAAYTDSTAYDAAGSAEAVRTYVGEIPETAEATNIVAYIQEKTAGIATDTALEELTGRVATAESDIDALQEASAKHVEKVEGKSLIADTEIERLAAMSDGANKVEASETNGNIKIDGEEVVVYTHPAKHAIADVDGLQDALDGKSDDGHKHVKDDITDFAHNHEMTEVNGLEDALAGKQDVIPENTYDAYGAAGQALTDAKAYVDEEDKFEIDMNTISALGGIAAGTNLDGMSTHDILKKLLYPYVDASVGNATASPNGGTYEKGVTKTITSVSISVTKKSEPITSVALYNGSTLIEEKTGDAVKNGGTFTFSNLSVEVPTDGNQLTVKVTYPDANGAAKTVEKKTTAMTFVYPYYMGTCAAGTAVDETLVESLTKKIESKGNKSNSFTVSDGHMVFAYPKAHGVLKSILDPNNFETIGNYTRSEVSVTGLDGTAQTYYVYVSGATTVSGFVVNFKY
jgi:hypothetical protein